MNLIKVKIIPRPVGVNVSDSFKSDEMQLEKNKTKQLSVGISIVFFKKKLGLVASLAST